jgi:hypothetical protein
MTRHLFPLILIGALAVPAAALAQHSAPAGAPSAGTAVPASPAPDPGPSSSGGTSTSGSSPRTYDAGGGGEPGAGRSRGNLPSNGTAVPRGARGGSGGGAVIIEGSGFYPWGYAYGDAAGAFGGYYGGYYGTYDPWYGFSPTYAPSVYGSDDSGSVRLKVKPSEARVYVDGFYAGVVDDFDGAFQRLRLDRGPHHIEMRQPDYQPLSVDVMIQEDFTITYRGEMVKQ